MWASKRAEAALVVVIDLQLSRALTVGGLCCFVSVQALA